MTWDFQDLIGIGTDNKETVKPVCQTDACLLPNSLCPFCIHILQLQSKLHVIQKMYWYILLSAGWRYWMYFQQPFSSREYQDFSVVRTCLCGTIRTVQEPHRQSIIALWSLLINKTDCVCSFRNSIDPYAKRSVQYIYPLKSRNRQCYSRRLAAFRCYAVLPFIYHYCNWIWWVRLWINTNRSKVYLSNFQDLIEFNPFTKTYVWARCPRRLWSSEWVTRTCASSRIRPTTQGHCMELHDHKLLDWLLYTFDLMEEWK